jgi:iron complex outermembrane receptor protein
MNRNFRRFRRAVVVAFILIAVFHGGRAAAAQGAGTIRGRVGNKSNDGVLANATVRIPQLDRVTATQADGSFEFTDLPPGTYTVVATRPAMNGASTLVTVKAGETATADFSLDLAPIHSDITVSASGREQLTLEAFQTVTSLDALDLAKAPTRCRPHGRTQRRATGRPP